VLLAELDLHKLPNALFKANTVVSSFLAWDIVNFVNKPDINL